LEWDGGRATRFVVVVVVVVIQPMARYLPLLLLISLAIAAILGGGGRQADQIDSAVSYHKTAADDDQDRRRHHVSSVDFLSRMLIAVYNIGRRLDQVHSTKRVDSSEIDLLSTVTSNSHSHWRLCILNVTAVESN
jgi:hypothetical protein